MTAFDGQRELLAAVDQRIEMLKLHLAVGFGDRRQTITDIEACKELRQMMVSDWAKPEAGTSLDTPRT